MADNWYCNLCDKWHRFGCPAEVQIRRNPALAQAIHEDVVRNA